MMELESMAVEMPEVEGHPNRAGFRGVLTVVDVASQRAPSGSRGHKVVLTRAAAEAALPSLLGMALDYAPSFDRHDQQRKVGVITSAEIVGRNLEVGGYLYAKDFPDIVKEIAKWGRPLGPQTSDLRRSTPSSGMAQAHQRTKASRVRRELAAAVQTLRELTAGITGRKISALHAHSEVDASSARELGMSYEIADVKLADVRSRVWILTRVTFTGAAILRRDKAAYENTWIGLC